MARDWVTTTVEDFKAWTRTRHMGADLEGARVLLLLARDSLEIGGPAEFEPGDMTELLLEAFPEEVMAEPDHAPEIAATARTLVEYLADTGAIKENDAAEMRDELEGIEPKLAEAIEEEGDDGAAEVLFGLMEADGVDVTDEAAVDRWVEEFGELSEEEQSARAQAFLAESVRLPPVRLAPAAELVAAAHASELNTVDDDEVLADWLTALQEALDLDAELTGELDPPEILKREVPGILLGLYSAHGSAPRDEIFSDLLEQVEELDELDPEKWAPRGQSAFTAALADLARWGVVRQDGDDVELTPLGVWAVRELVIAQGFTAPLVGDLAEATADELVSWLPDYPEDALEEEISGWLGKRDPVAAATELLEVIRTGEPGERTVAVSVLEKVDPADDGVAAVVREAAEDPAARPYAMIWLAQNGDGSAELDPADAMWIFTDTVAAMLESADPEAAIAMAFEDVPPDMDVVRMLSDLWRIDHPNLDEVLAALGDHHPDKEVSKAARRSAFKARSHQA